MARLEGQRRPTKSRSACWPLWSACLCSLVLLAVAQDDLDAQKKRLSCLGTSADALLSIVQSPGQNATVTRDSLRASLVQFASECLGVSVLQKPINMMVPVFPDSSNVARWSRLAKQFEQQTGVKVNLNPISFTRIHGEMLFEARNTPGIHDGFIFYPPSTGALVALGGLADLGPFIREDSTLHFEDYNRFYREISGAYGKQQVGLPMDGDLHLMYYRADLFARYNLTVPETWDDLLHIARKMNGTDTDGDGRPDLYGMCLDEGAGCKAQFVLADVAGPYIQSMGTSHGFFFDPESEALPQLKPLNNNPAMRAALKFWADIGPYSNTKPKSCKAFNTGFQTGTCLVAIGFGSDFRSSMRYNISKPGQLSVALLPGSTHVLDRATDTLVPCDSKRCPYGKAYTNPRTGERGWVNKAPFAAMGGWTGGVSAFVNTQQQKNAYAYLAFINTPENSWDAVLDPDSAIDPFRDEHMNDVDRWVRAGYNRTSVTAYLNAIKASLASPNIMLDTRLAYDVSSLNPYHVPMIDTLINITASVPTEAMISELMKGMETSYYNTITKLFANNSLMLAQQYWTIIGRSGSVQDLIDSRKPPAPTARDAAPAGSSGLSGGTLAAVVVVPASVLVALALLGVGLYLRHDRAQRHLSLFGKVLAPGLGPETTLVITDMQDSTTLFEALPVACMDAAMQLFCSITRTTLKKHIGFETATEGDSFIIAFHRAKHAVLFCIDLQEALLHVPWSTQVLEAEGVPSVHPFWVAATNQAHGCSQMLRGVSGPHAQTGVRWDSAAGKGPPWWRRALGGAVVAKAPPALPAPRELSNIDLMATHSNLMETNSHRLSISPGDNTSPRFSKPGPADSDEQLAKQWSSQIPAIADGKRRVLSILQTQDSNGPFASSGSIADLRAGPGQSTNTLLQRLLLAWKPCAAPGVAGGGRLVSSQDGPGRELVWAGPRVRCGVASGLFNAQDSTFNKDHGCVQFSGRFLQAAKLMESAAHGGQVELSQSTFHLLDRDQLPTDVILLHMGSHALSEHPSAPLQVPECSVAISTEGLELEGVMDDDAPSLVGANPTAVGPTHHDLYTILYVRHAPRLVYSDPPKVLATSVRGALFAPTGTVTIAYLNVVGIADLKAWNAEEAAGALAILVPLAKEHLLQNNGYLVDHVGGFLLATFSNALSALSFALQLQQDLLHAPWSPTLLTHALAEELVMQGMDANTGMSQNVVLFRGPRIKVGLATGVTKSEVYASTGRVNYRGKVLNRAARITSLATADQVLCSSDTWASAVAAVGYPAGSLAAAGLKCLCLGETHLKGINKKIEICQIQRQGAATTSQATSGTGPAGLGLATQATSGTGSVGFGLSTHGST